MWIYLSISSYTWEGETTRNEHWAGVVIAFFLLLIGCVYIYIIIFFGVRLQ